MTTAAICATRELPWRPSFYRGEQYDPDLALYYLRASFNGILQVVHTTEGLDKINYIVRRNSL